MEENSNMVATGSTIKIKRSSTTGAPGGGNTLVAGELAYSSLPDTGYSPGTSTGGDRLYIGTLVPAQGGGYNSVQAVIGGKYFTDMLDHSKGTLTASSAIVTDSDSKIDTINIGDITIVSDVIKSTTANANGSIKIQPKGTGKVEIWNNTGTPALAYSLPSVDGAAGYVLTTHADNTTTWAQPATTLRAWADAGYTGSIGDTAANLLTVNLLTDSIRIKGTSTQGIEASADGDKTITITAKNASATQRGVAKFSTSFFAVNDGQANAGNAGLVTLTSDVVQTIGYDGTAGNYITAGTVDSNRFKIAGDTTSGVGTTGSGSTVSIAVRAATGSALGVAKFGATYFTVDGGEVTIGDASTTAKGIAKFNGDFFDVQNGVVKNNLATVSGAGQVQGVAAFDKDNFTIASGIVTAKTITLGTSTLTLGSTTNDIDGLTSLTVGDMYLTGHTISGTVTDTDIVIDPIGDGHVVISNAFSLPNATGTAGQMLTIDTNTANTKWTTPVTELSFIGDDGGTFKKVNLLNGEILNIVGDQNGAISVVASKSGNTPTVTIKARVATAGTAGTGDIGVAKFSNSTFNVGYLGSEAGLVEIKSGGVSNTQLANSSITIGTTSISLGGSQTRFGGIKTAVIGDLRVGYDGTASGGSDNDIRALTNDINLILDGSGKHVKIIGPGVTDNYYTLPNVDGAAGYVLTAHNNGTTSWDQISTNLNIHGDPLIFGATTDYTSDSLNLITDGLYFDGDVNQGVFASVSDNGYSGSAGGTVVNISVTNATDTQKGVAKFNTDHFYTGSQGGNVALNNAVIMKITADSGADVISDNKAFKIEGRSSRGIHTFGYVGTNGNKVEVYADYAGYTGSAVTYGTVGTASFDQDQFTVNAYGGVTSNTFYIGSTAFNLGQTFTSTITGLTDVTIGNIQIHNGNEIGYTGSTNGDIVLKPTGTGTVDVSSKRITSVGAPTADADAATKLYVDSVAQGLHVHTQVDTATTAHFTGATYDNGTNNDGVGATITLATPLTTLDNHPLNNGDRVLVKNEGEVGGLGTFANGIYVRTSSTVFTRADDFNTFPDIGGGDFVFVVNGDTMGDTGWVQTEKLTAVGSGNPIIFYQFSGAGTYLAGDGLTITGTTFSVNVAANGSIEIVNDNLQLKSSLAGDGLSYDSGTGILKITGTDHRITVGADTVDIATDYVGQGSINTLSSVGYTGSGGGGVTTGTWKADTIGTYYGGTGQTTYASNDLLVGYTGSGTGAASQLKKLAVGSIYQFLQVNADSELVYGDIDGGEY